MRISFNKSIRLILAENITSNLLVMSTIFLVILTLGLLYSLNGYCTGFQRSGAVLVCFALVGVYLNHFVNEEHKSNINIIQHLKQYNEVDQTANLIHKLTDSNLEESEHDARVIVALKSATLESLPKLQRVSNRIVHLEFLSGISGTLIWAFADILFCSRC